MTASKSNPTPARVEKALKALDANRNLLPGIAGTRARYQLASTFTGQAAKLEGCEAVETALKIRRGSEK